MTIKAPSFFFFGIRQKLLLVLMVVLMSTLTISSLFSLNEEKNRLIEQITNRGSDISRFVSKSLVYSVVGYDYHTIDLLLKEITLSEEVGFAKVTNTKGKLLSQAGTLVNDKLRMQLFVEDIMLESDKLGELTLGINTDQAHKHIDSQRYRLIQRELMITLFIVFGEFIALSFLIIRPVTLISKYLALNDGVSTVAEIPLTTQDEFGQLANQFNKLNKQLSKANHELQNRVDFADKQLRNNVKELKAQKAELTKLNEKFLTLSITDELTSLYNRRYFDEHLATEVELVHRHDHAFGIILLDIDHFKNINDTYGHTNGDKVLQEISSVIKHSIRKTDIACRIGGEEFVIICKQTDKLTATQLAEKIRINIRELVIPIKEYQVSVTISAGVVNLNQNNLNTHADHLYTFADLALYFSKENGRNAVTHYDQIEKHQDNQQKVR